MGFFKKIGEKVKRVVSINNIMAAATGNFTAVAKDALRIATTNAPTKDNSTFTPDNSIVPVNTVIPDPVQNILTAKGAQQQQKAVDFFATKPQVQDGANQMTGFMTKVYWQSMWLNHKNTILAVGGVIVAFIVYKVGFSQKGTSKRRARR